MYADFGCVIYIVMLKLCYGSLEHVINIKRVQYNAQYFGKIEKYEN